MHAVLAARDQRRQRALILAKDNEYLQWRIRHDSWRFHIPIAPSKSRPSIPSNGDSSIVAASRAEYNSSPTFWAYLLIAGYKKRTAIFSRMKLSTEAGAKVGEVHGKQIASRLNFMRKRVRPRFSSKATSLKVLMYA